MDTSLHSILIATAWLFQSNFMGSFSIKGGLGSVDRISKRIIIESDRVDKEMKRRMELATLIVWKTATARRPKITKQQQKAMGRNPKGYRVSDPNAVLGVPVKTGALQISIKKDVTTEGKKILGSIYTDNSYAKYMEFGTSKIRPRAFMRPAMNEQRGAVLKIFKKPME